MKSDEITNSEDVIDSRNIIERINELESEFESLEDAILSAEDNEDEDEKERAQKELDEWEYKEELESLRKLQDEAEGYSDDWKYGATLIRESYFIEYCQEMLEDIGDLPKDLPSYIAIDWDQTAENLKVDYTIVDFDGVDYYVR